MACDVELAFFEKILKNHNVKTLRFLRSAPPQIDQELRSILGLYDPRREVLEQIQHDVIYYVTDGFFCSYIGLLLPQSDEVFLTGPYLKHSMTDQRLMALLEHHQLSADLMKPLKVYYGMLPLFEDENQLRNLFNTLGETLWGSLDAFSTERLESCDLPELMPVQVPHQEQASDDVYRQMIEARYDGERKLMHAVSNGMNHQAQMIISQWRLDMVEQRAADPLRHLHNYAIVLNTLLRKAAEYGHVHPIHIDQLSSAMARKIENFKQTDEGLELFRQMVHKYCLLVKNHSMQQYSKLVQQVILHIETDLTADLSLKAHAEQLNVNASYLSTLFKKETGVTLTDYVNRMRVDHAIFLLNTTDLQVQTIAQHCGISDVNYFTKLFKKLIHKTPKEYRMDTRRMVTER